MSGPLLTVEDLNVSFPGRSGITRAVRNASFTLGRERLGIVGESGSGKSTTGRAVLGLITSPGIVSAKSDDVCNAVEQPSTTKAIRFIIRSQGGGDGTRSRSHV